MQLGKTFNRNEIPENDSNFEPIPPGWYNAQIEEAEVRQTKAGNGSYLSLRYRILGPQYENRVIFGMVTISNPNEKAEQIGEKEMGSLMDACGLSSVNNTDQFLNKSIQIKVKITPAQNGYDAKNDVSGWKPMSGAAPSPAAPAVGPSPSSASAASTPGSAPPWATQ